MKDFKKEYGIIMGTVLYGGQSSNMDISPQRFFVSEREGPAIREGEKMQKIIVKSSDSNIKLEKYILGIYPNLSYSTLQKTFRKRDIKVNGTRIDRDYIVKTGDVLEIYITDDLLNGLGNHPKVSGNRLNGSADHSKASGNNSNSSEIQSNDPDVKQAESAHHPNSENPTDGYFRRGLIRPHFEFTVVYEDDNVLVVNKAQGIPVHPDKEQSQNTLIDQVRIYLSQKNNETLENRPQMKDPLQPSLCHRLDRNTGGLVIIAKNQTSCDILINKIESKEIHKYYKCLVKGQMERKEALLKAYLWKDARKSMVFVSNQKSKGSLEIVTAYKVLEYDPTIDVSLLEVELITGRTHQIRAHLAFIGHPILGDGKYGTNTVNRMFRLKMQALWAYKLRFSFKGRSSLDYLDGKVLTVEPGFNIKSLLT